MMIIEPVTMKILVLLMFLIFSYSTALSVNFSDYSDVEGGFPGPPKDNMKLFDICEFDDTITEPVNSDLDFKLVHGLFESDEVVPEVKYQVHITRKTSGAAIDCVIKTTIGGKFPKSDNNCSPDSYRIRSGSGQIKFNWTLGTDFSNNNNISFRINYRLEDNPTIYRAIFTFKLTQECHLHLHPESFTFNHLDLPKLIDCKIWFPSPNDGHGLVVELIRLNVPCNKGFIHFGGKNQTQYQHGRNLHKLCGKLEELPDSDRNIYFPETSKSQPFMHVHGNPTFTISYRLVDYCYNITFMDKNGTVELKPSGQLQCTFRIYMPYGNRVALKLQIGDSTAKEDPDNNIQLNFQDAKNIVVPYCSNGLLTQLHDGDSDRVHCTKPGDQEGQIEIVSKANKIVLKATCDSVETSSLKLRMSYRAKPVPEIVGSCEFGWVAVRQFCVSARDSIKMSWPKAEGECVRLGGHLMSVRSERDQKILDNLLTNR